MHAREETRGFVVRKRFHLLDFVVLDIDVQRGRAVVTLNVGTQLRGIHDIDTVFFRHVLIAGSTSQQDSHRSHESHGTEAYQKPFLHFHTITII